MTMWKTKSNFSPLKALYDIFLSIPNDNDNGSQRSWNTDCICASSLESYAAIIKTAGILGGAYAIVTPVNIVYQLMC